MIFFSFFKRLSIVFEKISRYSQRVTSGFNGHPRRKSEITGFSHARERQILSITKIEKNIITRKEYFYTEIDDLYPQCRVSI